MKTIATAVSNRQLKVQPHYRFNDFETKIVPEIKLLGNWLREAGFRPNSFVSVTIRKNEIILTPQSTNHDSI